MTGELENPQTVNITGPQGDTGAKGDTGPRGEKGEAGMPGLKETRALHSSQVWTPMEI